MSLNEASLFDVVRKQIRFKMKSYTGIYHSLIILQILGLFVASMGEGSMSEPGFGRSISVQSFGSGPVVAVTALWLFINTLLLTTRAYREDDFTFVSTRWSRQLANFSFIAILATLGTATAFMGTNALKVILFWTIGELIMLNNLSFPSIVESLVVLFAYLVLIAAVAYTIGSIVQRRKWLGIGISLLFILFGTVSIGYDTTSINVLIYFFMIEPNFLVLILKLVSAISLLFLVSWMASDNQEVRV